MSEMQGIAESCFNAGYQQGKQEKCDKCDYFISVEEAYRNGRTEAMDECINTIKGICSGWRHGIVKVIIDKLEQIKEEDE